MIQAIIIDDEIDARKALKLTVEKHCPNISIEGVYATPEEGIKAIKEINPQLVFLDIQMPRMSGFDLLKQAPPLTFEVIFVTAYDQYAIKAVRFSALDYLLKPVDIDDLRLAVERAKERLGKKPNPYRYQSVFQNMQHHNGRIEKLAVPTTEGIDFYNVRDIICCIAEGSYTTLHVKDRSRQTISQNLKHFESILVDSGFCRVHHSSLINLDHIQKYIKGEGGYVIMTDDHRIDISRRKKDEFIKLLNKI